MGIGQFSNIGQWELGIVNGELWIGIFELGIVNREFGVWAWGFANWGMGTWGLGIWGLGNEEFPFTNAQSPIPSPNAQIPNVPIPNLRNQDIKKSRILEIRKWGIGQF